MKNEIISKIKSAPKHVWILLAILALGIFLRTYHFADWMRFNSDQARDAGAVRLMAEGKKLPLLGPVAGGTDFQLGPIGYYFQYAGAKIFGATPDKMAYADLLWGILSIPLLYFLFSQYFRRNVALLLSGLYAICFFAIQYSRFAWNPNSASFFGMLFILSALKICEKSEKRKMLWPVLGGLSLGILVQLHTLLLVGMFPIFFLTSVFWFKKKCISPKEWLIIVALALILNIPQLISEIQTSGANYKAFMGAAESKENRQNSWPKNFARAVDCQFGSNLKIVMPLGEVGEKSACQFFDGSDFKKLKKNGGEVGSWGKLLLFVISYAFSIGGYAFLFYAYKKEKEERKKNFLTLVFIFNFVLMGFIFLMADEITLRYFIMLAFVPFIFLGFWLEYVSRFKKIQKVIIYVAVLILLAANFWAIKDAAIIWSQKSDMIYGSLGQMEKIAAYVIGNSSASKKIQIYGPGSDLERFANRLGYFTSEKGIEVLQLDKKSEIDWSLPVFAVINGSSEKYKVGDFYKYGYIANIKKVEETMIMKLSEKPL